MSRRGATAASCWCCWWPSAIVAVAVALMTIGRAQAQPYILGLLALLAMVGLFNLFAFAAGIIRFADRAADDPVMQPDRRSCL